MLKLDNLDNGAYHQMDIQRLTRDNEWLKAFYKHSQQINDKTVDMLNEVLSWRKEFNANCKITLLMIFFLSMIFLSLVTIVHDYF